MCNCPSNTGIPIGSKNRLYCGECVDKMLDCERKRCAKIAEDRTCYSPYTSGDKDLGWKMAAHKIGDLIRG